MTLFPHQFLNCINEILNRIIPFTIVHGGTVATGALSTVGTIGTSVWFEFVCSLSLLFLKQKIKNYILFNTANCKCNNGELELLLIN